MPAVARKTDQTTCPAHAEGEIDEGDGTVLVCHEPVARKGDRVLCKDGSIDEIIEGIPAVFMGGVLVACKGHKTAHHGVITTGCPRVRIGEGLRDICKRSAARRGSAFIKYVPKKNVPFVTPTKD
jgi:uncharacterized Zn-binding protein involved in type VI secretion